VEDEPVKDAITIINGHATCFDHIGVVRNNDFMLAVKTARRG